MHNYDPGFGAVAQPGDIVVSGYNFGTGMFPFYRLVKGSF